MHTTYNYLAHDTASPVTPPAVRVANDPRSAVQLTLAHYRNRFSMFRAYYALGTGAVKIDGVDLTVVEVADPPSRDQEEALIGGDVEIANLYLPNFLRRRLAGAPIVGLATEWKSTGHGNGLFVRRDSGIRRPEDLAGRLIASHQGVHRFHPYLMREAFGVDDTTLSWVAHPQEELLNVLRSGAVEAAVIIDQFYVHALNDPDVMCLYTDGDAWQKITGHDEMIKHMIAVREDFADQNADLVPRLLQGFRDSFAYSEANLPEVAAVFTGRYGGDAEALMTSARYPRFEYTFTERERALAQDEVTMLVETGQLERSIDVGSTFRA